MEDKQYIIDEMQDDINKLYEILHDFREDLSNLEYADTGCAFYYEDDIWELERAVVGRCRVRLKVLEQKLDALRSD